MSKSKLIYFHASSVLNLHNKDFLYYFKNQTKPTVIGCAGHNYRKCPNKIIDLITTYSRDKTKLLCQCPDLLGYNLKIPEELVYYGVDTEKIKFRERDYKGKLIISHYATNEVTKGTKTILRAIKEILKRYPNKFIYKGIQNLDYKKRIKTGSVKNNWLENIERMSKCDIYIETCNLELKYPKLNKVRKFGEWGNTCLEASATGCIVLTNSLTKDYYLKEYTKDYPLMISNSEFDLYNNLVKIANMKRDELKILSKKYRKWVEDNHSLKKTGERFINKFCGPDSETNSPHVSPRASDAAAPTEVQAGESAAGNGEHGGDDEYHDEFAVAV